MFDKNRPYLASVKEKSLLCREASEKVAQHVVIDLGESGLGYEVGDCLGVYPHHDPGLVEKTLKAMGASGDELIFDQRAEEEIPLKEFLHHKRNITEVNRKLVSETAKNHPSEEAKLSLMSLLEKGNLSKLKYFLDRPLWKFLEGFFHEKMAVQAICDCLQPLLPRFYSIASSQEVHKREVHLTVALVEYDYEGHQKHGVCTHYLCNLVQEEKTRVPIYVHKHRGFTLPEDGTTPIIMIGPGTGVAPFRGFMQERIAKKARGANWLFFGARHSDNDFYYKDFWLSLAAEKKLRLDLAFSRDQPYKIYVQDRMRENAEDFYRWLQAGARIFVCGDAKRMAKDVDRALHDIIKEQGGLTEQGAKEAVTSLRKEGRYLRDVY